MFKRRLILAVCNQKQIYLPYFERLDLYHILKKYVQNIVQY